MLTALFPGLVSASAPGCAIACTIALLASVATSVIAWDIACGSAIFCLYFSFL